MVFLCARATKHSLFFSPRRTLKRNARVESTSLRRSACWMRVSRPASAITTSTESLELAAESLKRRETLEILHTEHGNRSLRFLSILYWFRSFITGKESARWQWRMLVASDVKRISFHRRWKSRKEKKVGKKENKGIDVGCHSSHVEEFPLSEYIEIFRGTSRC